MQILALKSTLLIFWGILSSQAFAEYRVYLYQVEGARGFNTVKSTLDPVSYEAYNGLEKSNEVSLLKTWMCAGDTSKKDLCPSPYEEMKD